MGLGVVARYSTLVEAEVACSALRAGGFHAEVLEVRMASLFWTYQTALGGLRLAVPSSELQDAVAYLTAIRDAGRRWQPSPRDKGVVWRLIAFVFMLYVGPEGAWLFIGARDRAARGSALSLWGVVVVTIAMTLALVLAGIALGLFSDFIDGWLIHPRITDH